MRLIIVLAASTALLSLSSCSSPADIGCESDDDCRSGRICLSNKCVTPNNGMANNDNNVNAQNIDPSNTPNNVNPSNTPNNIDPSNTPNNVDPNNQDPDLALCEDLCDLLLGSCIDEVCDVSPEVRSALDGLVEVCIFEGFEDGEPGCLEAVQSDPDVRFEVARLVDELACNGPELEQFRCAELDLGDACGCNPQLFNDIGNTCNGNEDCDGGGLPGVCLDERNEPPFPDGYCVSIGCGQDPDRPVRFDDICGEGNVCWAAGDGANGVCVDGCESHDECRGGYQCRLAGVEEATFQPIRMCLPECGPNLLCRNDNERCADGRCEFECTDATPTGEPSGREICEALGFQCLPDDAGIFWCVMP